MQELLHDAAERGVRYLAGINARSVVAPTAAVTALTQFDEALPAAPTAPAQTLALLDEVGSPATAATTGGRYFGFVTGGALPAALAASWLATAWDNNSGLSIMSPTTAKLEEVALRWLIDLLDLPPTTGGGFVTGATMANFTALAAARHALLARQGWNVEEQGLFGAPPLTVVVGAEVHVSLLKALSLLGLGRERVVRVPVDDQGRMRADALPSLDECTILCLQAGNVNSGASDPLEQLCAAARQAGAWSHVDGAFGLWAAVTPSRAHLVTGLNQADSWATDSHKWLNTPYDSGIVFCRNGDHLRAAMSTSAAYLAQSDGREPYHYTPEMSRRARGVEVWAVLRSLGRSGLADLIERCCGYAAQFAAGLTAAGYSVLNDIVLNQVLVSFGDDARTRRVIEAVQAEGTCWCGGTTWHGHAAMRISVSSWATTAADVELSLAAIQRVAQSIYYNNDR
ncbi:MAG: aminotransferase class V-fold PLP-dependent enzyme [Caldilineaceae bacterium]